MTHIFPSFSVGSKREHFRADGKLSNSEEDDKSFPSGVNRDDNGLFSPLFKRIASRILLTTVN